jgi:hypothetical protein
MDKGRASLTSKPDIKVGGQQQLSVTSGDRPSRAPGAGWARLIELLKRCSSRREGTKPTGERGEVGVFERS